MMKRLAIFWAVLLAAGPLSLVLFPRSAYAQILEQTFREDAAKFQITTPNADWNFAPRSIAPGAIRATVRYKAKVDQFTPNVTVRVGLLPGEDWSLDKLLERDLSDLPDHIKVTEKKKFTHDGHAGYSLGYEDPKNNLIFFQWIFIQKGKTYVITAASRPTTLPLVEADLKKIMASFKFL